MTDNNRWFIASYELWRIEFLTVLIKTSHNSITHRSDLFGRGGGGGGGGGGGDEVVGGVSSGISESLVLGGRGGGGSLAPPILSEIDSSTSIGREPTE